MNVEQLRIADSYSCGVAIAPLKIKHRSAGLFVFAAKAFHKGSSIGVYYAMNVFQGLSSRQCT